MESDHGRSRVISAETVRVYTETGDCLDSSERQVMLT